MGDPKRKRKKYTKPSHPWQSMRMEKETKVRNTYGVKIKKEIWKMDSFRKKFADRTKALIASRTEQSRKEMDQINQRMLRLGLIDQNAKADDILGLSLESVMERRLQTLVWKSGMAKSPQQARQFITHGHITVGNKVIMSPSYIVPKAEEAQIAFHSTSTLADPEHPERAAAKAEPKKAAEEKPGKEKMSVKKKPKRKPRHTKQKKSRGQEAKNEDVSNEGE